MTTTSQTLAQSRPPAASSEGRIGPLALAASVSRFHIVAIAALGTFTFGWLFTGEHLYALAGVCALDWFLVNLLNRVVDLREDSENDIVGTDFVARNRRIILYGGFALLFGSFAAVHFWLPQLLPLRIGYHLLGMAYNWPLLPGGRRIKQLYFFKNSASAMGFVLTVFAYPLAVSGWGARLPADLTLASVALAAGFFVLFELSYEVIYDLRDAPGDAKADVRTYPVVHGEAGARKIIDGLLFGSLACLIVGYATALLPWRVVIMGVAPLVQVVLYKRWLRRGIRSADCIRLTWLGAGLLFAYHVWVALGLPLELPELGT